MVPVRLYDLPAELPNAFLTREANAAGVSRSRLRASDIEHPFHGVLARRDDEPTGRQEAAHLRLIHQYAVRVRACEFFSHISAALLWCLPLPSSVLRALMLDVSVHHPLRASRSRGVRGHQMRTEMVSVVTHPTTGYLVTSPASTWATLATSLPHLYDLVAAGDAVVRTPVLSDHEPALATMDQLERATAAGSRTGVARLREALPRIRTGSWSRTETWTRLLLVDAGLAEPLCNLELPEARGSRRYLDLAYPQWKIAVEYEGLQHLIDRRQWDRDIHRYERLVAEGWIVIRVTSEQLFSAPDSVIARVVRAIESRGSAVHIH